MLKCQKPCKATGNIEKQRPLNPCKATGNIEKRDLGPDIQSVDGRSCGVRRRVVNVAALDPRDCGSRCSVEVLRDRRGVPFKPRLTRKSRKCCKEIQGDASICFRCPRARVDLWERLSTTRRRCQAGVRKHQCPWLTITQQLRDPRFFTAREHERAHKANSFSWVRLTLRLAFHFLWGHCLPDIIRPPSPEIPTLCLRSPSLKLLPLPAALRGAFLRPALKQ